MLSLQNVTKEFRLSENAVISPVKDVSLDVARGQMVIIIGRSGTGKTTLLNLAAGLVQPTTGKVLLKGQDLGSLSDEQMSNFRGQSMGFIFQFPSLLSSLTIAENVALPSTFARAETKNDASARAVELLKMVGLEDKLNARPRQLSAGEQKRVVIARALMNRPELILADEPTSDLDEETEKQIMNMLLEINSKGVTFLIVTHSLHLLPCANRAFRMDRGVLEDITAEHCSTVKP
jgi:putative ABC transport system ATP-binding protein